MAGVLLLGPPVQGQTLAPPHNGGPVKIQPVSDPVVNGEVPYEKPYVMRGVWTYHEEYAPVGQEGGVCSESVVCNGAWVLCQDPPECDPIPKCGPTCPPDCTRCKPAKAKCCPTPTPTCKPKCCPEPMPGCCPPKPVCCPPRKCPTPVCPPPPCPTLCKCVECCPVPGKTRRGILGGCLKRKLGPPPVTIQPHPYH